MVANLFKTKARLGGLLAVLLMVMFLIAGIGHLYSGLRYASVTPSLKEFFLTYAFKEWVLFKNDQTPGLPVVQLFISEKSIEKLVGDPPKSIKKWQTGKVILPDGEVRDAKLRIRGDNFRNWGFEKKSWRFKLKKKQIGLKKQRSFNLIVPRENVLRDLIPYLFAKKVGVAAPLVEPVEVHLNGRPYGLMLLQEHPDENFLRNSGFMPVDLFKAEPDELNRLKGVAYDDLYSSKAAWRRVAKNNNSDIELKNLQTFIQGRSFALGAFRHFKWDSASADVWARFVAFQEAMQSWHNSRYANSRLIFDEYHGVVQPLVWDTLFQYSGADLKFNLASTPHIEAHLQDPRFSLEKRRYLNDWALNRDIWGSVARDLNEQREAFAATVARDPTMTSKAVLKRGLFVGAREEFLGSFDKTIDTLQSLGDNIGQFLLMEPKISWKETDEGLLFSIDDERIFDNVVITLKEPLSSSTISEQNLILRLNRHLGFTREDDEQNLSYLLSDDGRTITILAYFVSNQITDARSPFRFHATPDYDAYLTDFVINFSKPLQVKSVSVRDAVTQEVMPAQRASESALVLNPASITNRSGLQSTQLRQVPEEWHGEIYIEGVKIFKNPVIIHPGTKLIMAPSASVLFLDQVRAAGTEDDPIQIYGSTPQEWGGIFLVGRQTAGSVLKNIIIRKGSGAVIDNVTYTGMMMLVDTNDVIIEKLSFFNNKIYDDALRVVYSDKIQLRDLVFEGSKSDAIDLDLSSAEIFGVRIKDSGNDGIDLMGSKVFADDVSINNSGDKGFSIGEESIIEIYNSEVRESKIGIESKDGSFALIADTILVGNEIQVNAYKKNWRYHTGGRAKLTGVEMTSAKNRLSADKHSEILIDNSKFIGAKDFRGKVEIAY